MTLYAKLSFFEFEQKLEEVHFTVNDVRQREAQWASLLHQVILWDFFFLIPLFSDSLRKHALEGSLLHCVILINLGGRRKRAGTMITMLSLFTH